MSRIIRKTAAECRLTPVDKQRLKELSERPDSEIDFSDIPELTEEFWKNAVRNPFYRPVKKQVTLRIDADILAWLRSQGEVGYQSRLNAVLRQGMLQELQGKRKRA
ncbi:MAG: BrnA antitoxin family protein [Acidobacteriaceae bacterium]